MRSCQVKEKAMTNKVLAALAVGGLLVGAGFLSTVVSSPGIAEAQADTNGADEAGPFPRMLGFLDEVLDDLVADDTITQEQADAILQASEAKATQLREEHQAQGELLRGLLDDGVITEEEASQLPDEHPLLSERFDEAWEDGELTLDEIGGLHHRGPDFFERGRDFGALLDDGGIDQEEYDALDESHPLKQADVSEYLADGLITPDELRQIHQGLWHFGSGTGA
jgi:hypothetical protein